MTDTNKQTNESNKIIQGNFPKIFPEFFYEKSRKQLFFYPFIEKKVGEKLSSLFTKKNFI